MMRSVLLAPLAALCMAAPAAAEIHESRADGFIIRHSVTVARPALAVWLALTRPGEWWSDAHSWSGSAKNMTLTPQGGGCWCERLPGVSGGEGGDLEGSVMHGEVLMASPLRQLRIEANLGPLQSEPVRGVLTWALKEAPDGGTVVQMEYHVGGSMRVKPADIAPAIDRVLGEQVARLADHLGGAAPAAAAPAPKEPAGEAEVEAGIDALATGD